MALTDKLTAIGDAIREKEGSTDLIALGDMPERILALSTGGGGSGETDDWKNMILPMFLSPQSLYTTFTVPAGATKIYQYYPFNSAKGLKTVIFEDINQITGIEANAFFNCNALELDVVPPNLTYLSNQIFDKCYNLKITTVPEKITQIGNATFRNAASQSILPLFTIPATVTSIGSNAFYDAGYEAIRFKGIPTTIGSNAFASKTIKDIYVPWSSNYTSTMTSAAPWGATNAQIHYNVSADEVIE